MNFRVLLIIDIGNQPGRSSRALSFDEMGYMPVDSLGAHKWAVTAAVAYDNKSLQFVYYAIKRKLFGNWSKRRYYLAIVKGQRVYGILSAFSRESRTYAAYLTTAEFSAM